MDHHVKEKEEEKINKYMDLTVEVNRQFRVKTVIAPIVLGALGTVPAKPSESLKKLEIDDVTGSLKTAVNILYSYTQKGFKSLRPGLGLEVNEYTFPV